MRVKVFFCVIMTVITITTSYGQKSGKFIKIKGSAASIYGTRGSNGVIVINLLKAGDN